MEETRTHSKALHQTVNAQTAAKKELVKVQTARRNFLASWGIYVEKLQLLLKNQVEEQEKALIEFNQYEQKWQHQLTTANKKLAALSALEEGSSVHQVCSSSDSDMDVKADLEDPWALEGAARLKVQQEELASALAKAKEKAESATKEAEQRERTPRRTKERADKDAPVEPPPIKAPA